MFKPNGVIFFTLVIMLMVFGCSSLKSSQPLLTSEVPLHLEEHIAGSSNNPKPSFDAEKWVGRWIKIWNTYDLNQVDELFLQDDRLTYFSSEKEGAIIGIDKVRDHHRGFGFVPGGKDQPNKLWVEDLHAVGFGSSAVVTGIWYFQRSDGSKQRGPVTIVYIQQEDQFRIAHMNFSTIKARKNSREVMFCDMTV